MKKIFAKLLSFLLVVAMLVNNFSPLVMMVVNAQEGDGANTGSETAEKFTVAGIVPKGDIEVETHFVLPIRNRQQTDITLTIYDAEKKNNAVLNLNDVTSDGTYETTLSMKNNEGVQSQSIRTTVTKRNNEGYVIGGEVVSENIVYYSINLYSLDIGKYTLEFSGKNFATYSVDVELTEFSKRVSITDGKGMFEIGDINNDNKVDVTDEELMIREIQNNGTNYDLNLDGVVDIADLNYITAVINGTSSTATIENTSVIMDSSNVSFEIPSGTSLEEGSDLGNLFVEDKTVSLKSTSGEPISEENPVSLALDLGNQNSGEAVKMSEVRIGVGANAPKKLTLLVLTEDGVVEQFGDDSIIDVPSGVHLFTDEVTDGTIRVDLGKQIAVKKVTIKITETSTNNNLADIAKVEFLNNVKVETKAPEGFDIPQNIHVDDTKSEQLTVTFNDVPNVTGYEIKIVGPKMESGKVFQTTFTTFTIEDLKNYETYNIFVQSVNQEWRSGWSTAHKGTPQATRIPPKVDMVEAKGTFGGIDFSWKKMDDTKYYKLYYREVGANEFVVIDDIYNSSYQLRGLKPGTEYEAYIIGVNELGESDSYTLVKGTTNAVGAAKVPKYKLINDKLENGKTVHIEDVILDKGTMTNDNKFAMYDDDPSTYWSVETWAAGSHYNQYQMPTTVFDSTYKIDEIVFTVPDEFKYSFKAGTYDKDSKQYNDTLVYYWNTTEAKTKDKATVVSGVISAKKDDDGRLYYLLKLKDPIEANAIQLGLTNSSSQNLVQISEIKIYEYDSLVDDVADLFTDDLRLTLKYDKEETASKIASLRTRANTMDHEEYSPYKASVEADLDYAEKILNDEKIDDVITLDPNISNTYNNHLKFAMTISDYQPLGIVVRPGVDKTINVYVGSKGKVNAEIVFTQYHAEASTWNKKSVALKSGLNVIDVPTIGSADAERGGSVYIRYTAAPDVNNPVRVRVSGGTKIPMIDITDLTDEQEKKDAIRAYIEELTTYNANLTKVYSDEGTAFNAKSSVLGSTELVTKRGLFSVSSVAVQNGLKGENDENKVNQLYESLEAFDEMMDLFYRQKGLSYTTDVANDKAPKARINIRYMQMFDGAFMYAGGYHVGIEYDSVPGLVQGKKNSEDGTGYFGWGISHEVGHQINLNSTVFAEVTNNVYSLLAQTSNDKDNSRLENQGYDKIYDKVTSHTIGRAQNVFVQLGMYWQLHLAYDENKTFDDTDSIYAKINRIARNYNNSNGYTRDELTILFASMAAEKDLTEFFKTWGLVASDKLKTEISEYVVNSDDGNEKHLEPETKAIYYLNDKARRYKLTHNSGITEGDEILTASIKDADSQGKRVTLEFNVSSNEDKILGYEILRNGVSIGFVENGTNEFVDNIGAENNRAYTYEVVAYDYYLNKTNKVTLEEVKISHDGSVKKDAFTISSNVQAEGEDIDYEDQDLNDAELSVNNLIDGKTDTGFKGTNKVLTLTYDKNQVPSRVADNGNAYVIINLNNSMSISGIKYCALVENEELDINTIKKYKVSVSSDGEDWTEARNGEFSLTAEDPETTIYFQKPGTTSETQLWTFDNIGYVKIESVGSTKLSGAEIDVIAPPGDNIDISETSESGISIGKLADDYCYLVGENACTEDEIDEKGNVIGKKGLIKAGSVIIKGSYRGTPSLNVVVLADKDNVNNIYDGYGLLFAEVNKEDNSVYSVADGTWLYVMTQDEYQKMLDAHTSIRAYLYRVNDAIENSGQRITSTSKAITSLPSYEELQSMTIGSSDVNQQG